MSRIVKTALEITWTVSAVWTCTFIGAAYGWAHHGVSGAIALGIVGFCAAVMLATSPLEFLDFLSAGL